MFDLLTSDGDKSWMTIPSLYITDLVSTTTEITTLDTDEITSSEAFITVNKQITMDDEKVYITDQLATLTSTADCDIHIAKLDESCAFLESDTDNDGVGFSHLILSDAGNTQGHKIGAISDEKLHIQNGCSVAANDGIIFELGDCIDNGPGIEPTLNGMVSKFEILSTLNSCKQDLDMETNDILNGQIIEANFIDGTTVQDELNMINSQLVIGTADPQGRPQILYFKTDSVDPNGAAYDSNGPVQRMGLSSADGDASNLISEGHVVYSQGSAGLPMDNLNYSIGRVKGNKIYIQDTVAGASSYKFYADASDISFKPAGEATDVIHADATGIEFNKNIDVQNKTLSNVSLLTVDTLSDDGNGYIQVSGGVDFHFGAGDLTLINSIDSGYITLATTGGTQSNLDYYEEYSHVTNFSGIWAAVQAGNSILTRIGNKVTLQVPDVIAVANAAATISMDTVLPARFRPSDDIYYQILGSDNSVDVICTIKLLTTGAITIYVSPLAVYTAANNGGFYAFSISYLV